MKTGVLSVSEIFSETNRIDPSFYLSDGIKFRRLITSAGYPLCTIKECTEKVFMGNIFSRIFVSPDCNGVPYLAASDTVLKDLNTRVYLSKEQSRKLSHLYIDKDWILVTCSGTIGNLTYTNEDYLGHIATHDLIRIVPNNNKILKGVLYAFLASKYGQNQLTQSKFGGVVKHINCEHVENITIPILPIEIQNRIDTDVVRASGLRHSATLLLKEAERILLAEINLSKLSSEYYDYFGPRDSTRHTSTFVRNIKDVGTTSINAFNHSERIRNLRTKIQCNQLRLKDVLKDGSTFSTGQVSTIEVAPDYGIMFINQSDIFNNKIEGKFVSRKKISQDVLVKYGEILIACDGSLGESELFCRTLFAGEELEGALVSSHFLRMNTIDSIPSGYLYTWLNSDYGFRLIRSTQAGTKLCHPISRLLLDIPVPVLSESTMQRIDKLVRDAHTNRYNAMILESNAIKEIENLIDRRNQNRN